MDSRRRRTLVVGGTRALGDAERLARAREREQRRWHRARSIGIAGAVLLHLLFLLLGGRSEMAPPAPGAAAGPPAGDLSAAAGGGSGMTMIEIRPEQAPPPEEVPQPIPVPVEVIVPPPVPTPSTPAPTPDPGPAVTPSLPGTGGPGSGGDDGPAAGPGSGTGAGGGGTSDGGAAQITPPTPRGIFIPPQGQPSSARGQEITVWVFVRETGRVDRGTIRLEPPTSDSRYNQRLMQSVSEWVFDPARQGGRAIPAWYPFQIIL